MKSLMEKLEHLLELGGTKKDITLLAISGRCSSFSMSESIACLSFIPYGV